MPIAYKTRTCFWFDTKGWEAANFYVSLLPDSRIESAPPKDPSRPPMIVDFLLGGTPYRILNGGPHFQLTEAASITVGTEDQQETDRLWDALTANGGTPGKCAWLKDRFGLSWQIVPRRLGELLSTSDPGQASRVMNAMLAMSKIDIAGLEKAAQSA